MNLQLTTTKTFPKLWNNKVPPKMVRPFWLTHLDIFRTGVAPIAFWITATHTLRSKIIPIGLNRFLTSMSWDSWALLR